MAEQVRDWYSWIVHIEDTKGITPSQVLPFHNEKAAHKWAGDYTYSLIRRTVRHEDIRITVHYDKDLGLKYERHAIRCAVHSIEENLPMPRMDLHAK